jgi:drug/metabolite transporter (DMT)-like permease
MGDGNMLAIGSVLTGAAVLLVGLLALLFQHPRAPRWTRPELVVFLAMVAVTGMIGFGLGQVFYGISALLAGESDWRQLAALVLVPVVVALIWYALGIGRRLRAYAGATAGQPATVMPMPDVRAAGSTDQPPESPAPGKPPRRTTRNAA